jgi:hypothetical protein
VVKGEAELIDCIFNLPRKFTDLSQELSELLKKPACLSQTKRNPKKTSKKGKTKK